MLTIDSSIALSLEEVIEMSLRIVHVKLLIPLLSNFLSLAIFGVVVHYALSILFDIISFFVLLNFRITELFWSRFWS
jgi:hypothetical protein